MTDFNNLLNKAKELEAKMKESQVKIKQIQAEGVAGGDRVKIILNGEGEIVNLFINEELFNEDKKIVQDLIIAAHNNAKRALKDKTADEISKMTNQFGIPGFKWPF